MYLQGLLMGVGIAGTHAPGRAGQHFDLFDSIPLPHNIWFTRAECKVMPRDRYRLTVDYFCRFLRESDSEPTPTDPLLVWPRRDVSSAFLDVLTQTSIQGQQGGGHVYGMFST